MASSIKLVLLLFQISNLCLCLCFWTCQAESSFQCASANPQTKSSSPPAFGESTCFKKNNKRRYILYDVNPGEGFNMRRDVYVRIAPVIRQLNTVDNDLQFEWTLVLPPWVGIPHWKEGHNSLLNETSWSKFFNLDAINSYVPVMEMHQFLDEFSFDNPIDVVYKLQHLPLTNKKQENVKFLSAKECQKTSNNAIQWDDSKKLFNLSFWKMKIQSKDVKCIGLIGPASTLLPIIRENRKMYKAVMFNNAEVILWDNYGGEEWWKARVSLKFAKRLEARAQEFLNKQILTSERQISDNNNIPFIAVHFRRKDFLLSSKSLPTLEDVAKQLLQLCEMLNINKIFFATDTDSKEISTIRSLISQSNKKTEIFLSPCSVKNDFNNLSEGECAIIDQIICSWSDYFLGTEGSTFTFRIFEEREILGKPPDSTFNYLCKLTEQQNNIDLEICKKPTRWRIPENLRNKDLN